jgi:hypothetical protein
MVRSTKWISLELGGEECGNPKISKSCFKACGFTECIRKYLSTKLTEWLRSFTSNHLPLTAVGSNPDRDFGLFHVRKLSS